MPVIRHRSGPLAGKEQSIDAAAERITIGRDPASCDVVYPADFTQVARRHFALLRRPSGAWTFDTFGDPYVAFNGAPASAGQALNTGDIVELGKPGGASFEFVTGGKNVTSALPATEAQHKAETPFQAIGRTRNMALVALACGAVGIAASFAYSFYQGRDAAQLKEAITKVTASQEKLAADSISPAVRQRLVQSAYLVMTVNASGQADAGGTAFPIGPDLLGTNAHVADAFFKLEAGEKLFVRAPGANGKTYQVIEAKLHPGYGRFQRYLNEDPLFVTTSKNCLECVPITLNGSLAYDVATLRVAAGSNLSPIVEIASDQELAALEAGSPLGLAGYPTEQIKGGEIQGVVATPNLRTGMVSAITDMFHMPGDPEHRTIITHNIAVTGGNSGSPMLGANGKLVALLNSGNAFRMPRGRMPNAAVINYGQRADMLRDLMDGKADAKVREAEVYWAKQTANFARGSEYLMPWQAEQRKPRGATASVVAEHKGVLTKSDNFESKDPNGNAVTQRQKIHSVTLKGNVPGLLVAYGKGRALKLYAVVSGEVRAKDDRDGAILPYIAYKTGSDLTLDIYVLGGDEDIEYRLQHYQYVGGSSS